MDAWGLKPEAGFGSLSLFGLEFWRCLGKLCAIHDERTSSTLLRLQFLNFNNPGRHLIGPPCSTLNWEHIQQLLGMDVTEGMTQLYFDGTFMGANVGLESCYTGLLNLNSDSKFQHASVKMLDSSDHRMTAYARAHTHTTHLRSYSHVLQCGVTRDKWLNLVRAGAGAGAVRGPGGRGGSRLAGSRQGLQLPRPGRSSCRACGCCSGESAVAHVRTASHCSGNIEQYWQTICTSGTLGHCYIALFLAVYHLGYIAPANPLYSKGAISILCYIATCYVAILWRKVVYSNMLYSFAAI